MPPSLYHEKQVSLLCGQHALNSLLQGPYFTAEDLTAIAVEFDERERNLMRESGVESADFLKYMAEDSGNAAADGNYSIQVLTRALEQWNARCARRRRAVRWEAVSERAARRLLRRAALREWASNAKRDSRRDITLRAARSLQAVRTSLTHGTRCVCCKKNSCWRPSDCVQQAKF